MAYHFDGSNDHLLRTGFPVTPTDGFSASVWLKPDASQSGYVFSWLRTGNTNFHTQLWFNSSLALTFNTTLTTTSTSRTSSTALSTSAWSHVAVTWTGETTGASIKIYVNGTETSYSTSQDGVGTFVDYGTRFNIGTRYYDAARQYDGWIGYPALWSSVLSAADVASLAAGVPPELVRPDVLVSHWRLWSGDNDIDWWGSYDLTDSGSPAYTDDPPVQMSSGLWVPWQVAVATGPSNQTVTMPVATAAAAAIAPFVHTEIQVTVPVASASASAVAPTAVLETTIPMPVATAAASAVAPSILSPITITMPVAEAQATAIPPSTGVNQTVTMPVALATASAIAPSISATRSVTMPVAEASASAVAPSIQASITIVMPYAPAYASAIRPTVIGGDPLGSEDVNFWKLVQESR